MKKWVIVLVCIAVAAAAGGFVFYGKYKQMEKFLTEYNLKDIDVQAITDGAYNGKCSHFLVGVDLDAVVNDHQITEIRINSQDCGKGYEGRQVIDRVLKAQSLQVDATTGATGSSKCILIACERALASAKAQ